MFQGVFTAIVTPFKNGKVDLQALRELVEWQIQEGIHGLVVCGSTGEAMTLGDDEWEEAVSTVLKQAGNRVPVIAGAGSNSTDRAVKSTKKAYKLGVAAVLQVTPYYNKPTQEGLYQHFKAIAESTPNLPVVLYNVPSRTAVNMLPETVARLSKLKNIVGLKEACGDLQQLKKTINLVPKDFAVMSGEDAQGFASYDLGCVGLISVASNIVPKMVSEVWNQFESGNKEKSKFLQEELAPLNKAIFIETNPIPVKAALSLMGRIKEELRLPLTPMIPENKERLKAILKQYKLI